MVHSSRTAKRLRSRAWSARTEEALGILQPVKLNPTAESGKTFYTRANLERVAKAHLVEPEA